MPLDVRRRLCLADGSEIKRSRLRRRETEDRRNVLEDIINNIKLVSRDVSSLVIVVFAVANAPAQIATGGGNSAEGFYAVEGTSGQSAAGTNSTGAPYALRGGFWNPLAGPTAANVSISGRVLREDGLGIRNVRVSITGGSLTSPRMALTSSFGHFTFDDIEAGQSYVVSVVSKRYGFAQSSQIINAVDNVNDLVFISSWQN